MGILEILTSCVRTQNVETQTKNIVINSIGIDIVGDELGHGPRIWAR